MKEAIFVEGLTKAYDGKTVVDHLNLSVKSGTLDAARPASYRKLKTENDYAADNSRYLEAKRAKFKEIAKINKSGRKNRY